MFSSEAFDYDHLFNLEKNPSPLLKRIPNLTLKTFHRFVSRSRRLSLFAPKLSTMHFENLTGEGTVFRSLKVITSAKNPTWHRYPMGIFSALIVHLPSKSRCSYQLRENNAKYCQILYVLNKMRRRF